MLSLDHGSARLAVPTRLHAERIRKNHLGSLLAALDAQSCEFEVRQILLENVLPKPDPAPASNGSAADVVAETAPLPPLVLNPEYTFDQYVVGPCNRFAHAAARGVADRPASAFNPLFIHGSVGLGKTHLMQAVGHHLRAARQELHLAYLPCEQFINDFIGALQQGDLNAFRNRYRKVDLLVIDDVHLLANKARTQEEFFHTFNALHNAQKQIVLSSDSPPEEIPSLQERLVSRFKWGLVAEIEPPCFETRMAIVQSKAAVRGIDVPEAVAALIAENIQSNIRELEGALTKIYAMATLTGRPVDTETAREMLGAEIRQKNRVLGIEDILVVVTKHFGVKVSDLQSKRRTQSIVLPRQVAMWLARRITQLSLEEIGGYFGGRDHSTVVYALERINNRRQVDADFGAMLTDLEREIRSSA